MRFLTLVVGLLVSSILGGLTFTLMGFVLYGGTSDDFLWAFGFFLLIGSGLAWPIALVPVAIAEYLELSAWWIYALWGALIGVYIVLHSAENFNPGHASVTATLIAVSTTLAGLTYWLVAWKLLPPATTHEFLENAPSD